MTRNPHGPVEEHLLINNIKLNSTIGIFVNNERGEEELASMVMKREYGVVGLLQILAEYRRKGICGDRSGSHYTKKLMPFATVLI
ncbi:Hypothetical predicted protein [Cloeon dipterum]|uniref:Uncharacterized protein n=1 Tax=Cloeon dipterum TaxID=197152 RepID=A0A8S1C726_9INSE|nr:Hypothetical predicted protein [Cloeon dipterum]